MWPIEWHQCQCPWMTLKLTFAIWNLWNSHASWNIARINYSIAHRAVPLQQQLFVLYSLSWSLHILLKKSDPCGKQINQSSSHWFVSSVILHMHVCVNDSWLYDGYIVSIVLEPSVGNKQRRCYRWRHGDREHSNTRLQRELHHKYCQLCISVSGSTAYLSFNQTVVNATSSPDWNCQWDPSGGRGP